MPEGPWPDTTSQGYEVLRQAWAREAATRRQAEEDRRALALKRARAVAAHLKERYAVRAVYLYGSLAWGKHFTNRSDIDLLVEGFPLEADYWRALVDAEEIGRPFPVSLVLAETAFPSLYARATKEGIPL